MKRTMKKFLYLCLFMCYLPCFTGCSGCLNDIRARGGLVGEWSGDFIVVSQSGGEIMDCWKLRDRYVQSVSESDGWRFTDNDGDLIYIGGDVKVIRCRSDGDFDQYHEYHMEFENQSYREKFNSNAEAPE